MIDLEGTTLCEQEKRMLSHPRTGGVILFTRNYASPGQLQALVAEIHGLRIPRLLIAVDHEGGRVQRFRNGFTRLPPAHTLGRIYAADARRARRLAHTVGWILGVELRQVGIDFSFTPVLDLYRGLSHVIGDRAFHGSPDVVGDLAHHLMSGMREAGMEAVGKHFPGHGAVREDSHLSLPVDSRPLVDILSEDVLPFERMIHFGLAGIMPAHVVYEQADAAPAGYSEFWLKEVLRGQLAYQGAIFSDDLSMGAAETGGGYASRARLALGAGCDMVLVCNHPEGALEVLDGLGDYEDAASQVRLARMHGRHPLDYAAVQKSAAWREAVSAIESLDDSPWIELDV